MSHGGIGVSELPIPTSTLKRKREAEKMSHRDRAGPAVMIRQVADTIPPKLPSKTTQTPSQPDPKKYVQGAIVVRRVADVPIVKKRNNESTIDHSSLPEKYIPREFEEAESHPVPEDIRQLSSRPSVSPHSQCDTNISNHERAPNSSEHEAGPNGKVRRTSRQRKPTQTVTSDDLGTTARPSHTRRKAPASRSDAVTFSEMSAVALKALTNSNTAKNQEYLVAKLETEVIRKEGTRPESPSVKVRTIAQRQQEEKGLQRKVRAERRARRGDDDTSDFEGQSDLGDSIMIDRVGDWDENGVQNHTKHRRGPGEDEDYESPIKTLEDDDEDEREKKRVKWDRGLSRAIYVDQLQLGTRRQLQASTVKKGCLAITAKVRTGCIKHCCKG
jgi:hypothetical protein